MIERVTDYEVARLDDRCGQSLVRVPARDVRQRRFRADERRDFRLELPVDRERPADEAHASGSGAEFVEAVEAAAYHLRLIAKAQVIVRGKDEHLSTAVHFHPR